MNKTDLLGYFTSGLVFLIPIFILFQLIKGVSWFVTSFIEIPLYFAFPVALVLVTLAGFVIHRIFKTQIKKRLLVLSTKKNIVSYVSKIIIDFDRVMDRTHEAFNNPVLYKVDDGIYKMGFVTSSDLHIIESKQDDATETENEANPANNALWIFSPYPVNFSGELVLVELRKIRKLEKEESESIPLFILSGGILNK